MKLNILIWILSIIGILGIALGILDNDIFIFVKGSNIIILAGLMHIFSYLEILESKIDKLIKTD